MDDSESRWGEEQWQRALLPVWSDLPTLLGPGVASVFAQQVFQLLYQLGKSSRQTDRHNLNQQISALIDAHAAVRKRLTISERAMLTQHRAQHYLPLLTGDEDNRLATFRLPGTKLYLRVPSDAVYVPSDPVAPAVVNRFVSVPVWYLTDRTPLSPREGLARYGGRRSGGLRVGKATVSIPHNHERGSLERPGKILWWELSEDPARHISVRSVTEGDEIEWLSDLKAAVGSGRDEGTTRDILLFLHGYNTTFDQAIRRAAQLSFDIGFRGATVAYSWSSAGTGIGYVADEDAILETGPLLEESLTRLLRHSGARRVHIVAHSMGNRGVIHALREISRRPLPKTASDLSQVVFAAPDVGVTVFTDFIGDYFNSLRTAFNRRSGTPARLTLYTCGDDYALGLSHALNKSNRVGDSRQQLVVMPPLDTVDATMVVVSRDTHAYFVSNRDVLSDLWWVVRGQDAAERANLDRVEAPTGDYWTLRN